MNVKFKMKSIDVKKVQAKSPLAHERALILGTDAARMDTNPYVPRITGDLAGSADIRSQPSKGLLIYSGTYARAQYYGLPNKTKTFHPKAVMQWFQASKLVNAKHWRDVMAKAYSEFFGGR